MKEERLLRVLGQINEQYIAEAAPDRTPHGKHVWRKAAILAACLCLLLALSVAAYAANWFGLRTLLLPAADDDTDAVSLAGYQGSPEWQALAEWNAFLREYDPNGAIYRAADGQADSSLARYSCYLVYSRAMADKMDEITAKYNLKLHTALYDLRESPELTESAGNFWGSCGGYCAYMYEDGTLQAEGTVQFEDIGAWDFTLLRSVRGTFHDTMSDIGDISEYRETRYETACGVPVTLALGKTRVLILSDLEDSFVTVQIPYGTESGFTQTHLEALADSLDFSVLTPAVGPHPNGAAQTVELDAETRRVYAAVLRNLLHSGILPDGTQTELAVDASSQFAIYDADRDGREELILLFNSGSMADASGYIIGYDETDKTVRVQLEEFPAFAFLRNGNLKALDSHNQTWGTLWPYTLYEYLPETDSYAPRAHIHAEDKAVFEANGALARYPDSADTSNTGTVYYIGVDAWGTAPMDETDYLAWLAENGADAQETEITYLPLNEENILRCTDLGGL